MTHVLLEKEIKKTDLAQFDDFLNEGKTLAEHNQNVTTLIGMGYDRRRAHSIAMLYRDQFQITHRGKSRRTH